ncbi:type II secretion system F family protein [Pseudoduganella sp. OTU4001]|uniref:type II secretion system F family protein n=1 Tax=Pseudoduganella sp. OTU4001 TaxID=3043854 RepID=UPI00313EDC6A
MPQFIYRAMDAQGSIVPGNMVALNVPDLELRLQRMALDLIDCRETRVRNLRIGGRAITRRDLINFCFHLEQMSSAGVPILDGLRDLRDSTDSLRLREIITDLVEKIEGGLQLSSALAVYPEVFDQSFSSLVRAGEQSGKVNEVFRDLAESLKWQDELAAQARKAITYPAFVLLIVTGVVFFLMIYLVPQLTTFIRNMGQELPLHTRALIAVSDIFIRFWYLLLAAPFVLWQGARWYLRRSERAAFAFDRLKLRWAPVLHKLIMARFATYFALMYSAGIPVLDCIRLSEGIAGNRVVALAMRRARELISEGQPIAAAFKQVGLFPPLVVRMLRVGESTGALDATLRNVAYFYNREVRERIERMQAMIEPAMTVILGLLLGWIMLSVLGPIYDTISSIRI